MPSQTVEQGGGRLAFNAVIYVIFEAKKMYRDLPAEVQHVPSRVLHISCREVLLVVQGSACRFYTRLWSILIQGSNAAS